MKTKKILSVLLTILMVIGVMPVSMLSASAYVGTCPSCGNSGASWVDYGYAHILECNSMDCMEMNYCHDNGCGSSYNCPFCCPPTHFVTNNTTEADNATNNGYITVSSETAAENDTVTVTATPATGYDLDTVKITKTEDSSDVTSTVNYDSAKGTFTMPDYGVTVTATFKTAHEHSFDAEPEYTWSDDRKTCTGTIACTVEDCAAKISEDATVTCTVKEAATCRAMGTTTYCATFKDTKFSTQYKYVTDIDINHDNHTGGTEVRDGVTATCETEGYTGDTYCLGCGEKIADGTETPKDSANHTGTTEIRNAASANCVTDGYTGDTYCVGCGVKIADGQVIPATGEHTDLDGDKACDVCGFDMRTEHLTIRQQIRLFFKSIVKAFAIIVLPFIVIGK